jgi:hypothetical protein
MKMDTKNGRNNLTLKEALDLARSYLIAGGTFSEACEEAAREAPNLNLKLIQRHLLIELSAHNEQAAAAKINESLNKITGFSQNPDGARIMKAKENARLQFKKYTFSDELSKERGQIFSLFGTDYIFVGIIRKQILFIEVKTGQNRWIHKYVINYMKLQLSQ